MQNDHYTIKSPPAPKWTMRLNKGSMATFHLPTAPNRFHRLMQRVMLGIVWERIGHE